MHSAVSAAAKDGGDGYLNDLAGRRDYNGTDGANLRGRLIWKPDERSESLRDAARAPRQRRRRRNLRAGGPGLVQRAAHARRLAPGSRFDLAIDAPGFNRGRSLLGALSATRAGERVRWRATASWRGNAARNLTDYDLSPQPWFALDSRYRVRQRNLELRAESIDADAAWTWFGRRRCESSRFRFPAHPRCRSGQCLSVAARRLHTHRCAAQRTTATPHSGNRSGASAPRGIGA
jgi:hypothetical protein